MMNRFLSCDWGTSTLRISLVDGDSGEIICSELSDEGIANTFKLWSLTTDANAANRISFYTHILQRHIKSIEKRFDIFLNGVSLIISGMASSTIGFVELPYSELPFTLSGEALIVKHLPPITDFEHKIILISGIKSTTDVMRGEETQLMGCINDLQDTHNNEVYIFPGTHSKHIYINDGKISDFKTYMTGDFFELLSKKSILNNSVEVSTSITDTKSLDSFITGVKDASDLNLLNTAFRVRTNSLFNIYNKQENFNYLSGLLIGTELKDLKNQHVQKIHLLCGKKLEPYYHVAIETLGLANKLQTYAPQWVDEAVIRAHFKLFNQPIFKHD